ncbi:MAG: hypothetical protein ACUVX8_00470 [Candidatus Zipacnadales bacterium]
MGHWGQLVGLVLAAGGRASVPMVSPAIDELVEPFAYLAKPSTILGGIGASAATQVTWDGAFYTGAVELCIVTGDPPRPVAVRTKRLAGGHLPIIHYSWVDGAARYAVLAFAAAPTPGAQPANFIRLSATRLEPGEAPIFVGFGLRHTGLDHRAPGLAQTAFSPAHTYEFARGCALIDDCVVCIMPPITPDRRYRVIGERYQKVFTGTEVGAEPTTAMLLALWDLGRHEGQTVDLVMPWRPLKHEETRALETLKEIKFDDLSAQIAQQWESELERGARILLPESKPRDAYQASLAYVLMSTEIPAEGPPRFCDHLQAAPLSPNEAVQLVEALDRSGRPDLTRQIIEGWLQQQSPAGSLSPTNDLAEHCTILRCTVFHAWLVGDLDWAEQVFGQVKRAAQWLAPQATTDEHSSAELLAAYMALNAASEMAALVGKPEDAQILRMECERVASLIQTTYGAAALSLEDITTVLSLNRGLPDSPVPEFLTPQGEQTTELCRRLHLTSAEGLVVHDGQLDALSTMALARQHAIRGEQEQAIRDLYAILVHTGSCHEGFARGVRPWADRDSSQALSPDPRFAAAYMNLLRDLLICEQQQELHLFSALSPEWVRPGLVLGVHNAPTFFGLVTAVLEIEETGATFVMAADWHAAPNRVILHLPYFVEVTSVKADQPGVRQQTGPKPLSFESPDLPAAGVEGLNTWLELRPNTTRVTLEWRVQPTAQLSYAAAVEAWQREYADRYETYVGTGNDPLPLQPIPLR